MTQSNDADRRRAMDQSIRPLDKKMILAALLASGLIRLLHRSLSVSVEDPFCVASSSTTGLWCFWHNRALLVPAIYRSFRPRQKGVVLTSASRDGSFLARVAASFQLEAARGSSSRRGGVALRGLVRLLREGWDAGVTPDGPRGPKYHLRGGLIAAAALAKRPIIPLHLDFERCWRLKSWDAFIIPKPFSKVVARIGEPLAPPSPDEAAIEGMRKSIERMMRESLKPD